MNIQTNEIIVLAVTQRYPECFFKLSDATEHAIEIPMRNDVAKQQSSNITMHHHPGFIERIE